MIDAITLLDPGAWVETENCFVTEASDLGLPPGTPTCQVAVGGGIQWNPVCRDDEITEWYRYDFNRKFIIFND